MGADSTHRMGEAAHIDDGGIRMASGEADRILEAEEGHTGHTHKVAEAEVGDTLSTSSADSFRRAVAVAGAVCCCFWPSRSSCGKESSSSRSRRKWSHDGPLAETQSSLKRSIPLVGALRIQMCLAR